MHAIIYGTGKWALFLQIKLKSFGFDSLLIGNNSAIANYDRTNIPFDEYQNLPVFIASATKDHFHDLVHSLMLKPKIIFIEKGFSSNREKESAKLLGKDIPKYIMSQYRYSKIFDVLEPFKNDIISISYEWTVDNGEVSEWVPHIISIDNYIKNTNNENYANKYGSHRIDKTSKFVIVKDSFRNLKIKILTKEDEITMHVGTSTDIAIARRNGSVTATTGYSNEDTLGNQLKDIITNTENLRLERL